MGNFGNGVHSLGIVNQLFSPVLDQEEWINYHFCVNSMQQKLLKRRNKHQSFVRKRFFRYCKNVKSLFYISSAFYLREIQTDRRCFVRFHVLLETLLPHDVRKLSRAFSSQQPPLGNKIPLWGKKFDKNSSCSKNGHLEHLH